MCDNQMMQTLGVVVAITCGALLMPMGAVLMIFGGGLGSQYSPQEYQAALWIGSTELGAAVVIVGAGVWAQLKRERAAGVFAAVLGLAGMALLAFMGDPVVPFSWWLFGGALLGGVLIACTARPEQNDSLGALRMPRSNLLPIAIAVVLLIAGLFFIWRYLLAGSLPW